MPACLVGYWYYNQHLCTCCSHRLQLFIRGQKDAWLQLKDRCLAQPIGNWNCKCNPVLSGTSRAVFLDVKIVSMCCRTCGLELFSTIDQDTISSGNRDQVEPHAVLLIRTIDSTGVQMFYVLQNRMLHCWILLPLWPLLLMSHTVWLKWQIHWAIVHDLLICKFFLAVCSISCGTRLSLNIILGW